MTCWRMDRRRKTSITIKTQTIRRIIIDKPRRLLLRAVNYSESNSVIWCVLPPWTYGFAQADARTELWSAIRTYSYLSWIPGSHCRSNAGSVERKSQFIGKRYARMHQNGLTGDNFCSSRFNAQHYHSDLCCFFKFEAPCLDYEFRPKLRVCLLAWAVSSIEEL